MRKWGRAAACGLLWSLAPAMFGQTAVDLRTQSKSVDWRNAVKTFPVRSGMNLGSQCSAGEIFLRQDGESGRALYYCDTQGQWQIVGMPANGATGQVLCHDGNAPHWCSLGGDMTGTGADNRVIRLQGRPVSETPPDDGSVLGWNDALQSWTPQAAGLWQAGPGIGIVDSVLTVDDAVVPQYMVGSGAAAGPCTPGRDSYVDIISGQFYYCGQTDTWKTVADLTGVAKVTESNTFSAGQKQLFTPSAATAGLNVGTLAGDPSVPVNGDLWYNSGTGKVRARQNGANVDLSGATGSPGGLQKPSAKRFALFQYTGSGTALPGIGDALTTQGTGSASLPASDADETALNLASTASVDSRAEVTGSAIWRTGRNLRLEARTRMLETTGVRAFIGITSDNGAGATALPIATSRHAGFRYDAASDTTWKCYRDNNTGTPGSMDSGIAADSAWHLFAVAFDDANSTVRWYVDGAQVCSATGNYPGVVAGTNYNVHFLVASRTTEAVSKNLRLAHLYMESDR
ncbi:LamG-like jellyroll fold domain-containing protein [Paludibaculum fermentans]|uniref:LamG-like jellyroll fold domain-containing protein n=1 Tax=Paludibaculum fermentans TaxID=1473598 RepID=UPI003EBA46E5